MICVLISILLLFGFFSLFKWQHRFGCILIIGNLIFGISFFLLLTSDEQIFNTSVANTYIFEYLFGSFNAQSSKPIKSNKFKWEYNVVVVFCCSVQTCVRVYVHVFIVLTIGRTWNAFVLWICDDDLKWQQQQQQQGQARSTITPTWKTN